MYFTSLALKSCHKVWASSIEAIRFKLKNAIEDGALVAFRRQGVNSCGMTARTLSAKD